MGTPNWGRLFAEGRCKAIGIPFTDEEIQAIRDGVIPQDIQTGKWKSEIKKEVKETEIIGDEKEIKKQLRQTLRDKGISFTNFDTIEKLQEKLQANL